MQLTLRFPTRGRPRAAWPLRFTALAARSPRGPSVQAPGCRPRAPGHCHVSDARGAAPPPALGAGRPSTWPRGGTLRGGRRHTAHCRDAATDYTVCTSTCRHASGPFRAPAKCWRPCHLAATPTASCCASSRRHSPHTVKMSLVEAVALRLPHLHANPEPKSSGSSRLKPSAMTRQQSHAAAGRAVRIHS